MNIKILLAFLLLFASVTGTVAQKKTTKAPIKKRATTSKSYKSTKKPVSKTTVVKKVAPKAPVQTQERLVEISTDFGTMVAKLYDSTPLHRNNFTKLVEQGFYDSLLFHRVIENFMIQGGDPTSKFATDSMQVGSGAAPGERIAAEFKPYLFHKKGALAAARDNNPAKESSNCQFYIVQGRKFSPVELGNVYNTRVIANNPNFTYTTAQKEIYEKIGGTPFLDQNYTVFGEVISGLDVIDKIANVAKGTNDRPVQNVRMKIRLLN
jgi:peptidyl-prolyl cis-trans isomerase B (cyclophilin B)